MIFHVCIHKNCYFKYWEIPVTTVLAFATNRYSAEWEVGYVNILVFKLKRNWDRIGFLSLNLVVLIVIPTENHTLQRHITVVVFLTKCYTARASHLCLRNHWFNHWLGGLWDRSLLLEGKVFFVVKMLFSLTKCNMQVLARRALWQLPECVRFLCVCMCYVTGNS